MRRHVLLVLAAALLLAADSPREAAIKKERQALAGAWKAVSARSDGNPVPDDLLKQIDFVFAGDKLTCKLKGDDKQTAYQIDPTQDPKTIDISVLDGPGKGKTFYGIYELEGDGLKICLTHKEIKSSRPVEFTSGPKSDTDLFELRRLPAKN